MRLEFRLLVIDDQGKPEEAVEYLKGHLRDQGFSLKVTVPDDLSEGDLDHLAREEGHEFDLVIVDYRLRQEYDGPQVLGDFRRRMKFTEMIFYTADPVANLYSEIAEAKIDGVFVARRDDDLDDVLRGVADIVIGKAVDLNHMRGIAMAEVAEMDVLMEDTLYRALADPGTSCPEAIEEKIKDEYLGRSDHRATTVRRRVDEGGMRSVVKDGKVFTSFDKWRAIRALSKRVSGVSAQTLEMGRRYKEEVIDERNTLAHAREELTEDGRSVLRSGSGSRSGETTIKERWMKNFRLKLREHREAMEAVCRAIDVEFGGAGGSEKAEKP